jgi:hypothetical protein
LSKGTIEFFLNGISQGIAYTGVSGPVDCAVTLYDFKDELLLNSSFDSPIGDSNPVMPLSSGVSFKPTNGILLSNGNLTAKYAEKMNSQITTFFGTNTFSQGIHYWEIKIISTSNPSNIMIGICDVAYLTNTKSFLSHSTYGWVFFDYSFYRDIMDILVIHTTILSPSHLENHLFLGM